MVGALLIGLSIPVTALAQSFEADLARISESLLPAVVAPRRTALQASCDMGAAKLLAEHDLATGRTTMTLTTQGRSRPYGGARYQSLTGPRALSDSAITAIAGIAGVDMSRVERVEIFDVPDREDGVALMKFSGANRAHLGTAGVLGWMPVRCP